MRFFPFVYEYLSNSTLFFRKPKLMFFSTLFLLIPHIAIADTSENSSVARQSLDDAWWTGPLLAASPGTLPQGHFLIEPYIFDSIADERFNSSSKRYSTPLENDFGSQTYILYGLLDSTTIGIIPRFGYRELSQGNSSAGIGIGDVTLQGAFRLTQFGDGGWLPATALVIAETLPTGKFDRLSSRPSDGFGGGAYATALSIYTQYYFWTPNGRILRMRFDVTQSWSNSVQLSGVSVYATPAGFHGWATPGQSLVADLAFEYSLTRNWVAALDVMRECDGSTFVVGNYPQQEEKGTRLVDVHSKSDSSRALSFAPAIEYNWTAAMGIIVGAKITTSGRNSSAAVIPVAAINMVF